MTDNDQANDALELGRLRAKIAAAEARLALLSPIVPGLKRAAEMIEQRDGGKVWDDEVRLALEGVRNLKPEDML